MDTTPTGPACPTCGAAMPHGWMSPAEHQEALDAMALQVTYTEEGTFDVLRRFREMREERDVLAATVERVWALCASQGEDSYVMVHALRKALEARGD